MVLNCCLAISSPLYVYLYYTCSLADDKDEVDAKTYTEHIPAEIKKVKQRIISKEIEGKMTPEERLKEREIQRKQLEEIYKLMQEQDDKFGIEDMTDVSEQMKYYTNM